MRSDALKARRELAGYAPLMVWLLGAGLFFLILSRFATEGVSPILVKVSQLTVFGFTGFGYVYASVAWPRLPLRAIGLAVPVIAFLLLPAILHLGVERLELMGALLDVAWWVVLLVGIGLIASATAGWIQCVQDRMADSVLR